MPTKYDYNNVVENSQGTGGNAITTTVNKDSGYPIRVDGDYTLSDEEHDQEIFVNAGSAVTITLDPTELREGFKAYVYNNGSTGNITFTVDGSNFSGSTSINGSTVSSNDQERTVHHLTPGEFHISS